MNKLKSIVAITRLNRPIGIYLLIYPSLIAFIFASQLLANAEIMTLQSLNIFLYKSFAIIIIGSILVRSTGCVINDIFDRKFDKDVERTNDRPLATGDMSLNEALLLFLILGVFSFLLLLQTNHQTILIGLFTAIMIIFYPLSKRFILGPQFFLALTFGASVPIVFSILGQLNYENLTSILLLFLWNACWIISYDTIYALGDAKDDIKIGVNSTALMWGNKSKDNIKNYRTVSILLLLLFGAIESFSLVWSIGLLLVLYISNKYQNNLIENKNFLLAFKSNNYTGLAILMLMIVEIYILPLLF
tara:strand:+ start:31 stop:939 length:909 start_codon:yes stop_codon:yes gene_type:complete